MPNPRFIRFNCSLTRLGKAQITLSNPPITHNTSISIIRHFVRTCEQTLQRSSNAETNLVPSINTMVKKVTPSATPSSPKASPTLTAANLASHQRATAASSSSVASKGGGWVCGGEMNHRRAPPNPEQWKALTKRDSLAADIEDAVHAAASKAEKNKKN